MVVLSVSDVTLSFGLHTVLSHVSFSVNEGDRLAVIGVNGAGKTSLFRVITGEYRPDSGDVYLAKEKTVGLLRQDVAVMCRDSDTTLFSYMLEAFPELLEKEAAIAETEAALTKGTGDLQKLSSRLDALHVAYARDGGLEYRARCRSTLRRMGFSEEAIDRPVASLSGGQHTRLALSRLLAREPDILMLDEPTNHLDLDALLWLEEFLASYKKTVLLISHDRYFLDRVTNKTLRISGTEARLFPGNYTKYKEQEALEAASLEKKYKEQEKVIARIERNIQFQRECGMEHNFVTIRAKEKQLARMEKVEKAAPPEKSMRLGFQSEESTANEVVTAKDLAFSYGDRPIFTGLSFLIRKGERVLFLGENGCGKSTLMKLLTGRLTPTSGRISLGYNVIVGYYDQENRFLDENNTVLGELEAAYPHKTNFELRDTLARFLFGPEEVMRPLSALSGGERARLTLAKLMLKKINLLVMDEPTNHLDIASREVLENAVAEFPGTVVAVSHDRYFINRIATRIAELCPTAENGVKSYGIGDGETAYDVYLASREKKTAAAEKEKNEPSREKERYEKEKSAERERRNAEKKKKQAEIRAHKLEEELSALETELFGSAATDYVRASEIETRKAEIEEELLSLYELYL